MDAIIQKDFQNLVVLDQSRETAKEILLDKYDETVAPFVRIIQQVMKANDENHFEALKRIQDKTDLATAPEKKILFAAALMEIVEEVNLKPIV
ncbi:hypothetical protein [Flavobacterium sp.]|uniref:hypothetical protein n=1 Tax=Flavobacterium sp. TaxID=239 RepID=UPI002609B074|nr:hypothetical protein [Flavobacterium sp.]